MSSVYNIYQEGTTSRLYVCLFPISVEDNLVLSDIILPEKHSKGVCLLYDKRLPHAQYGKVFTEIFSPITGKTLYIAKDIQKLKKNYPDVNICIKDLNLIK